MSLIQSIPEGLKPQEVEPGSGRSHPPVPYIPEKIKEIDPDRKTPTIKIKLANGVESRVAVWEGIGTKEQFLSHMIAMREALEGMGLLKKHQEAEENVSEAKNNLKEAKELKEARAVQYTANITKNNKKELQEAKETVRAFKSILETATEQQNAVMNTIFLTTVNFFRGDGKTPWDKIVVEQTERDPWTNLRGIKQPGARGKTMAAWKDCYILMLKSVFANNAAEQQKFYLTLLRLSPKQKESVSAALDHIGWLCGGTPQRV